MDKVLPKNEEAELKILEGILYDNKKLAQVLDILKVEDFYNTLHKNIFLTMNSLFAKGSPINEITIVEEAGEKNIGSLGGQSYIVDIKKGGMETIDVIFYANMVKEKSLKRTLIKKCELIMQKSYDEKNKASDLFSELQNIQITDNVKNMTSDFDLFTETIEEIQFRANTGEKIVGLKTGFSDLDNAINGLQKGNLTVIGGRPSMGKTAFALNLIDNLGNKGHKGALFELEMDKKSLGIRRLAYECMINSYNLSRGELTDTEWIKLIDSADKKSKNNNIFTDVSTGIDLTYIKSKCKSLKNTLGLDFIVIDHLGLIKMPKSDRTDLSLGIITSGLKALAKELDIAVVLLCQLNRKCEERYDKRPLLSDLRDSGNIEQDADLIMLLYRDKYYNSDTKDDNVLEVRIAKQRNGDTGLLKFVYLSEFQKIMQLEINR